MAKNKPPELELKSNEKSCSIMLEEELKAEDIQEDGTARTILNLIITGMNCTACARNISKILKIEEGIAATMALSSLTVVTNSARLRRVN